MFSKLHLFDPFCFSYSSWINRLVASFSSCFQKLPSGSSLSMWCLDHFRSHAFLAWPLALESQTPGNGGTLYSHMCKFHKFSMVCACVCVCVKFFYQISFRSLAWVASDIEEVDELEEELSSSTFSPLAFACFLIFFCNFFLATLETDTIKSNHCYHCHGIARPNNELEWRENWLIAKDWPRIFLFSSSFKNFFFSLDSFFIRFTSSIIALASFTKS